MLLQHSPHVILSFSLLSLPGLAWDPGQECIPPAEVIQIIHPREQVVFPDILHLYLGQEVQLAAVKRLGY
jgi:hypothetical protein